MDDVRVRVMAVLLKTLYKQNLISEDVYNHSLDNLPKTLDHGQRLELGIAGIRPGTLARNTDALLSWT